MRGDDAPARLPPIAMALAPRTISLLGLPRRPKLPPPPPELALPILPPLPPPLPPSPPPPPTLRRVGSAVSVDTDWRNVSRIWLPLRSPPPRSRADAADPYLPSLPADPVAPKAAAVAVAAAVAAAAAAAVPSLSSPLMLPRLDLRDADALRARSTLRLEAHFGTEALNVVDPRDFADMTNPTNQPEHV